MEILRYMDSQILSALYSQKYRNVTTVPLALIQHFLIFIYIHMVWCSECSGKKNAFRCQNIDDLDPQSKQHNKMDIFYRRMGWNCRWTYVNVHEQNIYQHKNLCLSLMGLIFRL